MSRRPRLLLTALAMAALLWLLFAAAERALALAQRFLDLPGWLQWTLGAVLLMFAAAGLSVMWWLLRPRRKRRPMPAPDRGSLEQRIGQLHAHGAATPASSRRSSVSWIAAAPARASTSPCSVKSPPVNPA